MREGQVGAVIQHHQNFYGLIMELRMLCCFFDCRQTVGNDGLFVVRRYDNAQMNSMRLGASPMRGGKRTTMPDKTSDAVFSTRPSR